MSRPGFQSFCDSSFRLGGFPPLPTPNFSTAKRRPSLGLPSLMMNNKRLSPPIPIRGSQGTSPFCPPPFPFPFSFVLSPQDFERFPRPSPQPGTTTPVIGHLTLPFLRTPGNPEFSSSLFCKGPFANMFFDSRADLLPTAFFFKKCSSAFLTRRTDQKRQLGLPPPGWPHILSSFPLSSHPPGHYSSTVGSV